MRHFRKCLRVKGMKNQGGVRVLLMADSCTSRSPPDLPHPSKAMRPTFWATLRDPLHTWQSLPRLRHRLPQPPVLLRRANQANVGNAGLRPVMVMEAFGWMGRMGLATSERFRSPHSSIAAFVSKMAAGPGSRINLQRGSATFRDVNNMNKQEGQHDQRAAGPPSRRPPWRNCDGAR